MASVFPVAAGGVDTSTAGYNPTLYATKLLLAFLAATVLGQICNTDHEGKVKQFGEKVVMRQLPTITGFTYVKGMGLPHHKPTMKAPVELALDKGWGWEVPVNPLDVKQSDIKYVSQWADYASETSKVHVDNDVLSHIYSSAHASNAGLTAGVKSANINLGVAGTPLALTKTNILETFVKARQVLNEQNVQPEGTFMTIPPWCATLISLSDLKDASLVGDQLSILRTGRMGMIAGFTVYMSNNMVTNTSSGGQTASEIIFGHKLATTFASQMLITETVDNPDDYGQIIRGLQAYGYEVVQSEALGHIHAYNAA